MADVVVEPATQAHAEALAPFMRAEDAAEVYASGGFTPLQALLDSLALARHASAVSFGGQLGALCGVNDTDVRDVGCVWALTTPVVERHPVAFVRASRAALTAYLEEYSVLFNYVDARYAKALRWARALGFSVREAVPYGPAARPFHPIVLRRDTACVTR